MRNAIDNICLHTLLVGLLITISAVHSSPLQLQYQDVRFPVSISFPSSPKISHIPNPALKGSNIYWFVTRDTNLSLTFAVSIITIPNNQGSIPTETANIMIREALDTQVELVDSALGVKGEVVNDLYTSLIPNLFSSKTIEVLRETKPPQFGRYTAFIIDRMLIGVFASGTSSARNRVAIRDFVNSVRVHPNPLNYVKVVERLNSAAMQGDAKSQVSLAEMYYKGFGVEQDYKKAAGLLRKAAEQGNVSAQNQLGNSYYHGKGVPHDYKQAVRWYRKGAEQGDANSQIKLGIMYRDGKGVPQNFVLAHQWLNLAAAAGEEGAIAFRDWLVEKMTANQVEEAQRLAQEWTAKHTNRVQ